MTRRASADFRRGKRGRAPGRFFSHGSVEILEDGGPSRQASVRVIVPACVMQAVTPVLLGGGAIDSYELRQPLAAWIPSVGDDGFREDAVEADPGLPARANGAISAIAAATLEAFRDVAHHLKFPGDAIPVLPMGTYVSFRYRFRVDELAKVLEQMGGRQAAGVAELRYAMAECLAQLIGPA